MPRFDQQFVVEPREGSAYEYENTDVLPLMLSYAMRPGTAMLPLVYLNKESLATLVRAGQKYLIENP